MTLQFQGICEMLDKTLFSFLCTFFGIELCLNLQEAKGQIELQKQWDIIFLLKILKIYESLVLFPNAQNGHYSVLLLDLVNSRNIANR